MRHFSLFTDVGLPISNLLQLLLAVLEGLFNALKPLGAFLILSLELLQAFLAEVMTKLSRAMMN